MVAFETDIEAKKQQTNNVNLDIWMHRGQNNLGVNTGFVAIPRETVKLNGVILTPLVIEYGRSLQITAVLYLIDELNVNLVCSPVDGIIGIWKPIKIIKP